MRCFLCPFCDDDERDIGEAPKKLNSQNKAHKQKNSELTIFAGNQCVFTQMCSFQ